MTPPGGIKPHKISSCRRHNVAPSVSPRTRWWMRSFLQARNITLSSRIVIRFTDRFKIAELSKSSCSGELLDLHVLRGRPDSPSFQQSSHFFLVLNELENNLLDKHLQTEWLLRWLSADSTNKCLASYRQLNRLKLQSLCDGILNNHNNCFAFAFTHSMTPMVSRRHLGCRHLTADCRYARVCLIKD